MLQPRLLRDYFHSQHEKGTRCSFFLDYIDIFAMLGTNFHSCYEKKCFQALFQRIFLSTMKVLKTVLSKQVLSIPRLGKTKVVVAKRGQI